MQLKANNVFDTFSLLFLAVIIFTGLVVLIKYTLLTISGLYEPVFAWIKLILNEEKITNNLIFQSIIILKILSVLIASGFIFIIYSALSTVFSCIFYKLCSRNYKKVNHPLKFSLIKGMKWNFYRTFLITAPPLSVIIIGSLLLISSIVFFNFFIKIAGLSVSFSTFFISFISFSLFFLFIFSLLFSLWQLVSTIFGIEIAVSEPKLQNKIIETRSKKLIFSQKTNILLGISYLVFIYNIIIQIKYVLISDLLASHSGNNLLNIIILFNLGCFMILEYLKASSYVNSLMEHSKRISKSAIKVIIHDKKND